MGPALNAHTDEQMRVMLVNPRNEEAFVRALRIRPQVGRRRS